MPASYYHPSIDQTGGNWRKHFSYLKRLVAESIGTTQPSPSWRERVETLTMPLWAILRRTGLTAVQGVAIAGGLIALLVWMGILAATKVLPPKEKVPAPPPPVACVIEFTPPGAKGVWVDPQDRSDLGLRERPLAKPDVPLGVYLQAFLDVVDRSHPDVNADGMLSQMATELKLDRSKIVGTLRLPADVANSNEPPQAALDLIQFGKEWGPALNHDHPENVGLLVAYIDRDKLLLAWPESDLGNSDPSRLYFRWPEQGGRLCDQTDLTELRKSFQSTSKPEWQKPILENQTIILCGEVPNLVWELANREIPAAGNGGTRPSAWTSAARRWQTRISPGKASEVQPLEAKFNFHLAPDVMLAKLQHRTTADPYFRLILLSTVLDLQDTHTGPRDTGTEKSFASLANSRQLQDLQLGVLAALRSF